MARSHVRGMASHSARTVLRRLIVPAGCVFGLVAGCAVTPGQGPAIPAAGTQFDGVYQGENRLIRGSGFICGPPAYGDSVTVSNGGLVYQFAPAPPRTVDFPAQIAADGLLHGQMQYAVQDYVPRPHNVTFWVTIDGRITGGTLDAIVADDRCSRHLTLQKR